MMQPSNGTKLTLLLTATFAIVRIAGVTDVFFKAFAHLYVGGLFGAAIVLWRTQYKPCARFYLALAVFLTVIETLVAIISRIFP